MLQQGKYDTGYHSFYKILLLSFFLLFPIHVLVICIAYSVLLGPLLRKIPSLAELLTFNKSEVL